MGQENDEKQHLITKKKSNLKNNSDNNKDDVIVIIPNKYGLNIESQSITTTSTTNKNYGSLKNVNNSNNNNDNDNDDHGDDHVDENFPSLSMVRQQKLTYTWKNLDVYGEVPSQHQQSKTALFIKQIKSYCLSSANNINNNNNNRHNNKHKHFKIPIARKQLLKNVYGCAKSGELLAVMGSSGAGKTTLLNALAFRSPSGVQISGSAIRSLNGIQVDAMELRARCAYVQQEDLFIGSLTAKEHLIFQAMLRMDRKFTTSQKIRRAEEVIMELSLGKCQNTIIGIPGRAKGLSGGERKRLAFASESLTDPPILLCDEPTSGLDSFMAHSVLKVLTRLAQKGKTIILTIHQPSSELFSLFDKILLMAEGRIAFMGTAQQATTFFNHLQMPCPTNYNPADFYVQILAIVPGTEDESREKIRKICDSYACCDTGKDTLKFINSVHEFYDAATSTSSTAVTVRGNLQPIDGVSFEGYRASWWTQFTAILWRSWLTVLKEPLLVRVRLIQTVIVAVLIGVIFFGQQLDQDGVMNINGAIFLFLTNMTFQNVFAVINVFCAELPVFLREHRSRLYKTETYFLGKTLAECPLFLVVPFVFTSIVYPMIGLQKTFTNYFVALLIVTLIANVSTSFGYLISSASSSVAMALSIGPPVIIPFLIFGGFLLNTGSVPIYFKWLSYLSWFRYGNEALLINQWKNVQDGDILCTRSNTTCPRSGHIILETLDFDENFLPYDILALIALIIAFRLLSLFALCIRARSKE